MNELAEEMDISRETAKKAYNLLCRDGILVSRQGKGFFIAGEEARSGLNLLVLLDKQSIGIRVGAALIFLIAGLAVILIPRLKNK